MTTARLTITGMSCDHCRNAVRNALLGQPGVRSAEVDLQAGTADVEYDESGVTPERLMAAVKEEGYTAAMAA